jgi:outer membrane protein OmpA-like peptidoglycan-associated protein/tetratricopeptide (TPR) repeat protein
MSSIVIVLLFSFTVLRAQEDFGCGKPSKKAQKEFDKAHQLHFKGRAAYQFLIEAVKIDPEFAAALSALAFVNGKKDQSNQTFYKRTISYYEKTREACPAYRNYEASFIIGKAYFTQKKYDLSKSILLEFKENGKVKEDLQETETMLQQMNKLENLLKNKVPFDPKKVAGASTEFDEYMPMLSPDNQYLFFTRKAEIDSKSIYGMQEKELYIQSRRQYNGKYSEGIPMPTPFNLGSTSQGGSSISVDNRLLFITIVNQVSRDGRGFQNGDIYYSEFSGGKWGTLKSIGDHINGQLTWEGQPSISADNQTLYFSSARPENIGGVGMDLYKTEKQANGSWGPAINLGPTINTSGNEKSPFMHSDSYTLYFSSDGHPGVGGQDIFFTKVNKFGSFETPENIGVPINTPEDEHGFMVSTDGHYGYYSSNMGEKNLDIYYFDLPEKARPKEVVFAKGSIGSKDPDAAKGMTIELKNTETNKTIKGVVDEENGEYVAVISASKGQDVMLMAKKNGYAFTSQYINSKEDVIGKPIRAKPMEFNPIEEGETYQINNINFASDSYELNNQVVNILNEFIVFLEDNSNVKIAIYGHTDNIGNPKSNLDLSSNRANAVKNYLLLEGISSSRITAKGFGESSPISTNSTNEGRAKNRRTEFVILSK